MYLAIPVFGRLKGEDLKLEASLGHPERLYLKQNQMLKG